MRSIGAATEADERHTSGGEDAGLTAVNAANSGSGGNVYARSTRYDQYIANGGYLYHSSGTPNGYSASWNAITQNEPSGASINSASDIAAVSWGNNRVDILAWQNSTTLWHIYWDGSQWNWEPAWTVANGGLPACNSGEWGIDITSSRPNYLQLAMMCTHSDSTNHLHVRRYANGSSWESWVDLGAPTGSAALSSGPAITSWAGNRVDIFLRRSDGNLQHVSNTTADSSGWSTVGNWTFDSAGIGTTTLGHPFSLDGDPDAAAWGPNRLDVVIADTFGSIQKLTWDGSSWAWDSGGINGVGHPLNHLVTKPSIVAEGDQRLWVSAVDSTGFPYYGMPWYYPYDFGWGSFTSEGGTAGGGIESSYW